MKIYPLFLAVAFVLLHTGCVKDNLGDGSSQNKVDGPVFDFATTKTYTLNVKYDVPEGYVVGFEVYPEDPFEVNAEGQSVLKTGLNALDKGFTNTKGTYSQPITLPSYIKTVYVYTSYAGVNPRLLVAEVENGQLSNAAPITAPGTKALTSKAGAAVEMNTQQSNAFQFTGTIPNTLTLGKWHVAKDGPYQTHLADGSTVRIYGRPAYMSYVDKTKFGEDATAKDAIKVDKNVLNAINTALKGDGSGVPVDPKFLKSGDINVTKEAELDLIFIQNWGAYRNTLAYYCYETANPPASPSDIQYQTIAIPNAMELKWDLNLSYSYNVVSMYQGEGVKLKYVDQNGVMHDKFPAGTSVGWVLYRDGFSKYTIDPALNAPIIAPSNGQGANYSNPVFSQSPNTAVLRYGNFVVVGFDDGDPNGTGYRDYLDVMFNVQASPADALDPEIPDVDPEEPKPVKVKSMGILLYEDLWPYQGDFDMNDVVVKYVSTVTKDKDNAITNADIDYTILHSGATLDNSFAYYSPNTHKTLTISGGKGSMVEDDTKIVRLANNVLGYANNTEKVTFNVHYDYIPIPAATYVAPPFNPFITVGSKEGNTNGLGKEVHLTNYTPTSVADKSWFEKKTHDWSNPDLGLYYITFENHSAKLGEDKGQQLPFAVNIVFSNEADMNNFKVTVEGKHINKHYTGFKNWVNSNGKENADWYLHFTE